MSEGLTTRRFRRLENVILYVIVFTVAAISFVVVSVTPPDSDSTERVVGLSIAMLWAILAVRALRMSVATSQELVTVRNLLRTHRINWTDVDHFGMGTARGLPMSILHVVNGRKIGMGAIAPPNQLFRPRNTAAQRLTTALEAERIKRNKPRLRGSSDTIYPLIEAPGLFKLSSRQRWTLVSCAFGPPIVVLAGDIAGVSVSFPQIIVAFLIGQLLIQWRLRAFREHQ